MKKYLFLILNIVFTNSSFAHEPLYGLGPDVLFKGGLNPHLTFHFNKRELESEMAFGYGITRNWTGVLEMSSVKEGSNFHLGSYMIKSNYRFLKIDKPGLSYKASFVSELIMPFENTKVENGEHNEKSFNCTFTAGQESLKWYWFVNAGFEKNLISGSFEKENYFRYGVTLGARPFKPDYYKPDIVFLIETTGKYYQKAIIEPVVTENKNGSNINIAPTFIFTYRNFALRGGLQFGVYNSENILKTETNGKITIELHI